MTLQDARQCALFAVGTTGDLPPKVGVYVIFCISVLAESKN